jgi:hypothetical protein
MLYYIILKNILIRIILLDTVSRCHSVYGHLFGIYMASIGIFPQGMHPIVLNMTSIWCQEMTAKMDLWVTK